MCSRVILRRFLMGVGGLLYWLISFLCMVLMVVVLLVFVSFLYVLRCSCLFGMYLWGR